MGSCLPRYIGDEKQKKEFFKNILSKKDSFPAKGIFTHFLSVLVTNNRVNRKRFVNITYDWRRGYHRDKPDLIGK